MKRQKTRSRSSFCEATAASGAFQTDGTHRHSLKGLANGRSGCAERSRPRRRAGEKLRAHGLVAGQIAALFHTSPHRGCPHHHGQRSTRLVSATSDTRRIIGGALRCVETAWQGRVSCHHCDRAWVEAPRRPPAAELHDSPGRAAARARVAEVLVNGGRKVRRRAVMRARRRTSFFKYKFQRTGAWRPSPEGVATVRAPPERPLSARPTSPSKT